MALRVNIWSDESENEIAATIHPFDGTKYEYNWQVDGNELTGEGELFSIIPLSPLDIVETVLTSIKERLRKDE